MIESARSADGIGDHPVPPADVAAQRAPREARARRLARLTARVIRTRTLAAAPHPAMVSFSFDDVPASAATHGAPILEAAGARGTFYVAGGLVAGGEPGRSIASAEQCRDLHRRGHEIGCHTYGHRPVSGLAPRALDADLARNAAFLASLDPGLRPTNFAYPFNTTSLGAKIRLQGHYATCRGGVPGINGRRIDTGFLRAVELADGFLDADGARTWIARAVAERGWLVFFSHGVGATPEPWGCHPALLAAAVAAARECGAGIVPVREAVARRAGESARATA